jgi:hypothetical protein
MDGRTINLVLGVFMTLFSTMMQAGNFEPPSKPVKIILDTDMATDCDDAGALAVLHAFVSLGEAEILAVVADNKDGASIGAVAAINAFYGRPDIPLGAYQETVVGSEAASFVQSLARDTASYGHRITSKKDVPPAVDVYRKVLAEAPDAGVVIVSIGHLNNLSDLLHSKPDQYSPLDGMELVRQKTAHLVVMGGDYPDGKEHNFFARGSAPFSVHVVDQWPTPILFSGYTLGEYVMTGPGLIDLAENHPVRRAYAGHGSRPLEKGRSSWDQTAIVAAVRGASPFWKLSKPGRNKVESDGANHWVADPAGSHYYLIEKRAPQKVAEDIGELMNRKKD